MYTWQLWRVSRARVLLLLYAFCAASGTIGFDVSAPSPLIIPVGVRVSVRGETGASNQESISMFHILLSCVVLPAVRAYISILIHRPVDHDHSYA